MTWTSQVSATEQVLKGGIIQVFVNNHKTHLYHYLTLCWLENSISKQILPPLVPSSPSQLLLHNDRVRFARNTEEVRKTFPLGKIQRLLKNARVA